MKLAIISDIHSNKYALDAVLRDIGTRDIDRVICLGDLVGYLVYPNEVVEMIEEHNITTIMGNHDQVIAESSRQDPDILDYSKVEELQKSASQIYTNLTISEKNREFLSKLPMSLEMTINDIRLLFVHGSPRSINEYMHEEDDLLRDIGAGCEADVIVSGHTHLPYFKKLDSKIYINPGSVGKPKHGNSKASYVIVEVSDEIKCDFIELAYDVESMIEDVRKEKLISDSLVYNLFNGV